MAPLPPPKRFQGHAFTLIELLVTIAIVAVLGSLILGSWGKVKERSQVTGCTANLREIYMGMTRFANEHENIYPKTWTPTGTWSQQLVDQGYVENTRIFKCPGDTISTKPVGQARSYAYCVNAMLGGSYYADASAPNRLTFEKPSRQYMVTEWHCADPLATWNGDAGRAAGWDIAYAPTGHAKAGRSFLFADGHIEQRSVAQCADAHSGWVYNEFP